MRNTTGTGSGNGLESRIKDALEELYKPSSKDIETKETFHYRLKNGPYKGTPSSDWDNAFISEVLGVNLKLSAKAVAWFKNTDSYEEAKLSNASLALNILTQAMKDPEARWGDRIKAAEMSLKINGEFDKEKDSGEKTTADFSPAQIEDMKRQGIDVTPYLKKVK